MTPLFGHTRSVVHRNYALLDPAGFVSSVRAGWTDVTLHNVIAPVMGARFSQTHITFGKGGTGGGNTGDTEWCGYLVNGKGRLRVADREETMIGGGYVYVPPQTNWSLKADRGSVLVLFEKRYSPMSDGVPPVVIGHSSQVLGQPFLGDPMARLQVLLPDQPIFDLAMNVFTFDPGATLPFVETHVMEHGLVMLSGQGIYRLGNDWHPVRAGDVIWMGSYCPQWFVAMGRQQASYLYYKDVNRPPL